MLVFFSNRSGLASASAWIPLLYDTIIFGLTLYRTVPPIRREEASYIIKRLLEDGILYYRYYISCFQFIYQIRSDHPSFFFKKKTTITSVIFSVTFVLTFMIVAAPPGTKNIAAQ